MRVYGKTGENIYICPRNSAHSLAPSEDGAIFFYLGSIDGHLYLVFIAIPLTIHYHPYYLGDEMKDEMLIGLFKVTELIARASTHLRSK